MINRWYKNLHEIEGIQSTGTLTDKNDIKFLNDIDSEFIGGGCVVTYYVSDKYVFINEKEINIINNGTNYESDNINTCDSCGNFVDTVFIGDIAILTEKLHEYIYDNTNTFIISDDIRDRFDEVIKTENSITYTDLFDILTDIKYDNLCSR